MKVVSLTKKFGKFTAVDEVSLELKAGIVTCILGHNGAGKTTLINSILGIEHPTSGSIFYKGKNVYENPEIIAGKTGYCSSDECLYEEFTVSEFLLFLAHLKGIENPH